MKNKYAGFAEADAASLMKECGTGNAVQEQLSNLPATLASACWEKCSCFALQLQDYCGRMERHLQKKPCASDLLRYLGNKLHQGGNI